MCVGGRGGQAVPQQTGSAESDDGCWRQTAVALIGFWIWRDEDGELGPACTHTDVLAFSPHLRRCLGAILV